MAIVLFDNSCRNRLFPLTYTKAIADLRFGILTIKERWEALSKKPVFVHTEKYLQALYAIPENGEHLWIDAAVIPDQDLLVQILALQIGFCITDEKGIVAVRADISFDGFDPSNTVFQNTIPISPVRRLTHPWQMMQWNDAMIRYDFDLVIKDRYSQRIPTTVSFVEPNNIFIEDGAKLSYCTLNASTGPIYIGKEAEIMEGSAIRGPFVLGNHSVLKMNSRIYGATTLGPYCMGGGEIKNAVMMGYSNKAHDGYLGDAVVGEWCNFGAGSTNSNVKNTAGIVKVWDMGSEEYISVGLKCGVIMGDYSRLAINSSINTGSVIGVSCNVFGAGLLPTIIANFSWGVNGVRYEFEKLLEAIENWKGLKQEKLTTEQKSVLQYIFEHS